VLQRLDGVLHVDVRDSASVIVRHSTPTEQENALSVCTKTIDIMRSPYVQPCM
jgi:hypothetical protein